MLTNSKRLSVTAVESADGTKITAFINELPGLLVQGTSDEDVAIKMDRLLDAFTKKLEASKNNLEFDIQRV